LDRISRRLGALRPPSAHPDPERALALVQREGWHVGQARDLDTLRLRRDPHALPGAIVAPAMKRTLDASLHDRPTRQVGSPVRATCAQGARGAGAVPEQHDVTAEERAANRTPYKLAAPARAVPGIRSHHVLLLR